MNFQLYSEKNKCCRFFLSEKLTGYPLLQSDMHPAEKIDIADCTGDCIWNANRLKYVSCTYYTYAWSRAKLICDNGSVFIKILASGAYDGVNVNIDMTRIDHHRCGSRRPAVHTYIFHSRSLRNRSMSREITLRAPPVIYEIQKRVPLTWDMDNGAHK